MKNNFYDKVAKKFGGYAFGSSGNYKCKRVYPNGDPEKIFKNNLIKLAGKKKIVLDAGCGDGKFAFGIAKYFSKIIGIDNSKELLKIAAKKKAELRADNISFELQDANKTTFENGSFDVIFSRRGPTPFSELKRLLKPGGYFVGIGIGEKDTKDIEIIFGRGQNYGGFDTSRLKEIKKQLKEAGFKISFAKEYFYNEYYASYDDLDRFLQGVPIFEDFDSKKDKKYLQKYASNFLTKKGINLPRHRVVLVAKKVK